MDNLPTPTPVNSGNPSPLTPRRNLPLGLIIGGIIAIAAGVGYSIGALKQTSVAPATTTDTIVADSLETTSNEPGSEVALAAESISIGGKMVVTGTISHLTPNGFSLEVTVPTINTASRAISQHTVAYNIKLTPQTKLTQYTFTSTIPPQGGQPQLTQVVVKLTAAGLKEGAVVTVTGDSASKGTNLVAADIRVTSLIKL